MTTKTEEKDATSRKGGRKMWADLKERWAAEDLKESDASKAN